MHTCANQTGGNISHLEQMVNSFLPYSQQQLGFDKPVKIVFQSDPSNADVLLGKTAHYNPEQFEVYLYTDKRHPKDVMRSLSHELVHHAQNCRGDFGACDDTGPGYAQRDPHLRKMEREAYTKGNLIFRDFEDLIKRGRITIDINFKDSGEPQMSLKEWKDNELNTLLMKKWGLLKEGTAKESADEEGARPSDDKKMDLDEAELEERYNPDEPEATDPWSYERGVPSSKRHPRGTRDFDDSDPDAGKATTAWERKRNKEISARQLAKRNRREGIEEETELEEGGWDRRGPRKKRGWGLDEDSQHPGESCEEAHPESPGPAGHKEFMVGRDGYVGRSKSELEEISYRDEEEGADPDLARAMGVGPKLGAKPDLARDRVEIPAWKGGKKKGWSLSAAEMAELPIRKPGEGSAVLDRGRAKAGETPGPGTNVAGTRWQKAKTHKRLGPVKVSERNQKISVREAKEITRRIIERIRKEGI